MNPTRTVPPGATIEIWFDTFAGSTGAPITMTGLAASTVNIKVYKNGSAAVRASASGYALLDGDGIDFDGLTGIHGLAIDLSDNTTADFWACGSRYSVIVTGLTVDGQAVRFVAARFTIGYEGAILNTTIATLASQTSFTLTAGSADNNAYIGCDVVIHDAASAVQVCMGTISAYTGATKTVTLAVDPAIFTVAAKDNISIMPRRNVYAIGGTAQTARDIGASVAVGTGGITAASFAAGAIDAAAIATDAIDADAIKADAVTEIQSGLATAANLATVAGYVDTEVAATAASAATAATQATNAATSAADIQTRIPAALVSGRMDSSVGAMAAGVLTAAAIAADAITAAKIATGAIDADALAADFLTAVADGILKRDMSAVSGESSRSLLNAARFIRNKWSISGTTLTVTKEDDTTAAWTATVTASAGADPISAVDPA